MRLTAVTATHLVALILCVEKVTSKCTKTCASCVPCRRSCGPDEVASPVGVRQQDNFCKPKLTNPSELNKLRECLCKPGYLRNAWGKCVRKEDCYSCLHKANMDFNYCSSSCPTDLLGCSSTETAAFYALEAAPARRDTAGSLQEDHAYAPTSAPSVLRRPLQHVPALIKSTQLENPLKCVRIDECPGHESSRCRGRHQTYTTCKPRCPATCASNATRICLAGCAGEGCVCKTRLRHPQRKSFDVRTSPRLSSQAHDVHRSRSSVHDVQITLPALVLGQWTSSMHGRLRWITHLYVSAVISAHRDHSSALVLIRSSRRASLVVLPLAWTMVIVRALLTARGKDAFVKKGISNFRRTRLSASAWKYVNLWQISGAPVRIKLTLPANLAAPPHARTSELANALRNVRVEDASAKMGLYNCEQIHLSVYGGRIANRARGIVLERTKSTRLVSQAVP
ncbi:hypothetical protein HPB51_024010 [Rhipicephalus microplus]|uniref:Uncharacterized protein n=1 Tax=Rhipicephalus microplus TaxID=6941 RepID=A0A9J6ED32_RHIMP|nr:hypothetical protein HPB51_024010 [Rhipicephalus microplus]